MTMELRVFPHHGDQDTPHWHVQWVEDGGRGLVLGENCGGYDTEDEAQIAAAETLIDQQRTEAEGHDVQTWAIENTDESDREWLAAARRAVPCAATVAAAA